MIVLPTLRSEPSVAIENKCAPDVMNLHVPTLCKQADILRMQPGSGNACSWVATCSICCEDRVFKCKP